MPCMLYYCESGNGVVTLYTVASIATNVLLLKSKHVTDKLMYVSFRRGHVYPDTASNVAYMHIAVRCTRYHIQSRTGCGLRDAS